MKEQNEVLCSVIYDSIDLFVDFKKKGYVYGKHITNDDKVVIRLHNYFIVDILLKVFLWRFYDEQRN